MFSRQSRRLFAKCASSGLIAASIAAERQRAVGLVLERLRLDAAEHRRAAAFPAVGVRHLADDVLVAAAAVAHDRDQVALRAAGDVERRLLAEQRRDLLLQRVDASGRRRRRRRRPRRGRPSTARIAGVGPRHRVAAQVDHAWIVIALPPGSS